jgi:hypothetical protein
MRLVVKDKKEGEEGEALEVDEQFGCRKTKRRPRSVDSIPCETSYLVFPYGGGRINKKKERPSKPFTVSQLMTTILTDDNLKEGYR